MNRGPVVEAPAFDEAPFLAEPPLPAPAPRRSGSRWLLWLAGVVAGGLILGAVAAAVSAPQRRSTTVVVTPQPASRSSAAGAPPDAAPSSNSGGAAPTGSAAGARAGSVGAARTTNGVIASVEGDTIVVNTADGPVRVTLGDNAAIQKQVPAERGELSAGQRIVVSGERVADGAVTASGVQILSGEAGDRSPPAPSAAGEGAERTSSGREARPRR